jgi:hypothetical protein
MKKIILLILIPFLTQSQTLLKLKQLENATAGSVITTTGSGTPTWTNSLPIGVIPNLPAYQPTVTGGYLTVLNPAYTGTLTTGALSFTDTGILAAFQSSTNGYNQLIIQNTSTNNQASSNLVVGNNSMTAGSHYVEIGKNSSTFTGTSVFSQPNYGYVTSTSADLALGTTSANAIHIAANSATTDAITVSSGNSVTIPGRLTLSTYSASASSTNTGIQNNGNYNSTGTGSIGTTFTVGGAMKASSTLSLGVANLTGGNTGTVAVLTDALFSVDFFHTGASPADASTYYFGSTPFGVSVNTLSGQTFLPYNCTLVGWSLFAVLGGGAGSSETSTLSINGTTNYTLTSTQTYSAAGLYQTNTVTAISQNFNAGDVLNIKWVTPTWATNPLTIYQSIKLWFVRRK